MSPADFILAFLSIVLALALQEVLQGVGGLVRSGRARDLPVAQYLFALALVGQMVLFWWGMWFWRTIPMWTIGQFGLMLLGLTLLYLLAFLVFPKEGAENHQDYYLESAGRLWLLQLLHLAVVALASKAVVPLSTTNWTPLITVSALTILVRFSKNRVVHAVASALLVGLVTTALLALSPLLG